MKHEVLRAENVGKSYPVFRSDLVRFARWFGFPFRPQSEFWALRDISFALNEGESIAIIGQNGAGKSTLLKVITGTVRPNVGAVRVGGTVGAILELGLGFNPELTGRQNLYHSGGLLGMSVGQIGELMEDIEEFAEIGEFMDQPLRVYSSGMQARLAFSLVTAVRPQLLIVDEVLSVGDAYFQHKSFARIRAFREQGTSILLVTHSMNVVTEICDRAILLDEGRVVKDGLPDEVVDYYNAMISARENAKLSIEQRRAKDGWMLSRSGTFEAVVTGMSLFDADTGKELATAQVGQRLRLKVDVAVREDLPRLVLGVMIRDRTGHVVWGTNTWHKKKVVVEPKAGEQISYDAYFKCCLGPGSYSVSPALVSTDTHLVDNYEWTDNMFVFDVVNFDKEIFIGSSYIDVRFEFERHSE